MLGGEPGGLETTDGCLHELGWRPAATSGDAALADALLGALKSAGSQPPTAAELAERHGGRSLDVLRFLERSGSVVQVEAGRYYERASLTSILDSLSGAMERGKAYAPAELREAIGLSRKYLIPLLEYCDAHGFTAKTAAGRVWRSV
jgi:selenocysteine-specific elongation factor